MKTRIEIGDKVVVTFGNGESIVGIVESMPMETGDSWIILRDSGPLYVQQFETIGLHV